MLSGNLEAMANLSMEDLDKILAAILTGMTVDEFNAEVKKWIDTGKHPRWKRLYTELAYQPMIEVMPYLRANDFKTCMVTGGAQDFLRVYSEQVYGIPTEQVVGTMGGIMFGYDKNGRPMLTCYCIEHGQRCVKQDAQGEFQMACQTLAHFAHFPF